MTPYRKQYLANLKKRKEAAVWENLVRLTTAKRSDHSLDALVYNYDAMLLAEKLTDPSKVVEFEKADVAPTPWTPWNPAEQRVETKKREDIEKQVAEAEATMERVGKFISSRWWRG
jgi:hypothetical protein